MKVAVCYVTLSAREDAHEIAQLYQLAHPADEVVLYDCPLPSLRLPRRLVNWGAEKRVFVDSERRGRNYGY